MDTHPCTRELEQGCVELGIPRTVARELLRFLLVRRFNETDERMRREEERMSPSAILDQLWHWCLLETDVRDRVEALVGKMSHTTRTKNQDDAMKMARRLRTMEAMANEGWFPDLQLWQEPGTMMHSIAAVKTTLPGTQGEVTKFYCAPPGVSAGHTEAVPPAAGKAAAPQPNLSSKPLPQTLHAAQVASNCGPGKRKRLGTETQAVAEAQAGVGQIEVQVRFQDSSCVTLCAKTTTLAGCLFKAVAKHTGLDEAMFRLLSPEGIRLDHRRSIADHCLQDRDYIDCMKMLEGC